MITATIVLYKNDAQSLKKTVDCFLEINEEKKLFLVDNSPTDKLKDFFIHPDIEYFFIGRNIGFGNGHNHIIHRIKDNSKYHLVLNPDVIFSPKVISNLMNVLDKDKAIMVAPAIIFPNGDHQYSCRRFPTFFELMARRVSFLKGVFKKRIAKGMYLDKNLEEPFYAEYLSGCFQLYKTKCFIDVGGFDKRYFMYLEDVDICRKINRANKHSLYYPKEKIIHTFEQGSSKKAKLFFYHLISIFRYFYKWNVQKTPN